MTATNKIHKILISIFVFGILVAPALSFSAGLVPECVTDPNPPVGVIAECTWGWDQFMELINNVISFILFKMVVPIAAIMFAYAGFMLVTSGGEVAKRTKAKSVFTNVAIGLVIAAAAWLIIRTILSLLGYDGAWIGF